VKLYNQLTKQNNDSARPVKSRLVAGDGREGDRRYNAQARQVDRSQPYLLNWVVPSTTVADSQAWVRAANRSVYRLTQGTNSSETRLVVNAIYCQVMDIFSGS